MGCGVCEDKELWTVISDVSRGGMVARERLAWYVREVGW